MTADVQLDTLEAKGLIRLAAVRPELEYLFRHALLQEAAYGSLLKQERRDLHGLVGEALEALYPERRGELAAVLGMHFEQAGETAKAIDYLVAAGRYGLERNAIKEAHAAFDRAAALLQPATPDDPARRLRVEISLGRAQAGFSFLPPEELVATLEAIVPEAAAVGDPELEVQIHTLIALGRIQQRGNATDPAVQRSLARIAEIGESIGNPSVKALPLALIGMNNVFAGTIRDGVRELEEAVPLLERLDNSIGAAFARGALAIGYARLGQFAEADEAARRASEVAQQGDLIAQLDALIAESAVRGMEGKLDDAVPLARECVQRSEETGATACAIVSSWVLGDAYHRQGRFEEAREVLRRGAEIAAVVDRKVWRPTLVAWLGTTSAILGAPDPADWEGALATAHAIGNFLGEAGIRTKRAEAAIRSGSVDAALADLEAASQVFESQGARPNLARSLRTWGEALRSSGKPDEAQPILERSRAIFEELGLEREAGEVTTVLSLAGSTIAFG
jgi:tetratricopeptide (TPR) repeat protein